MRHPLTVEITASQDFAYDYQLQAKAPNLIFGAFQLPI
jgi:hypothetical protein